VQTDHYYQEIDGWFTTGDAQLYAWLVSEAPDGATIVEVGSWKGRSLSCLLVEAKNSGKNLRIVGVDGFAGSVDQPNMVHEANCLDLEQLCRQAADRAGYPYEIIRGDSADSAALIDSAWAVFIDASHDAVSVKRDIDAWLPKIVPGGVMAGHDVDEPGVQWAICDRFDNWGCRFGRCWQTTVGVLQPCEK
jgi:hypothetical protein